MMPDPAADAGRKPTRLSIDLRYLRVEVSQQQPTLLQAALIHHEPAHRGRRIRARSNEPGREASAPATMEPNRGSPLTPRFVTTESASVVREIDPCPAGTR
jgi:hypothetical protein